jgi:UbiD family decarboxylase
MDRYVDLRDWLDKVEALGELKRVDGASCDLEIGTLTDLVCHSPQRSAVLFQNIPGYPPGYRIAINATGSFKRLAMVLGVTAENKKELVDAWAEKLANLQPMPPAYVDDGPVLENSYVAETVDITRFPAPLWHKQDGGRYLGTASVTITQDPDDGWINLGTYRVMVVDKDRVGFYISPGKHGRMHREKYFSRSQPCPVAISFGHDPVLFAVGAFEWPHSQSEYGIAGGIKGSPIEVIKGDYTGLAFPARSELVLEGEAEEGVMSPEGPFGEWTGYYASGVRQEVTIKVKAIYHRHDPIILSAPPLKPPNGNSFYGAVMRSAKLKRDLQMSGVPDVVDVWFPEEGGGRFLCVVSIKQRYPGHARQVGLLAMANPSSAYMGRYVIVVDDDIDVTDLSDVIWAVITRTDPAKSIDLVRRLWSGPLDPVLTKEDANVSSRAIIDACRPYERLSTFPPVIERDRDIEKKVLKEWGYILNAK